MAAEIKKELGLASALAPGEGGIFEVRLDGRLVFTNESTGGVPSPESVIEALKEAGV